MEKIVKINGIQISNTGFKNLQFETSRTSDGIQTIRGFGGLLREQNLNIIDTVSMDFILNYYELKELAYIYCLFKANGILPVENEYFLNKIKGSYQRGKETEEEITKDPFIKDNISHLICFLESMSITSIERTNNSYKVNLVLTLYNNVLTKEEYNNYMFKYNKWNTDTGFEDLCMSNINEIINNLKKYSDIEMKIYNVETLNSTYKEHILNNASINTKLNLDNEYQNELKAQTYYENSQLKLLKNKKTLDIDKLGKTIIIPNNSILQIELRTQNIISNTPIIGSPIGNKSYLGIGPTHFSAKLIFNEHENDIVESLKRISDKNIINHKIELDHPLVKLFDFNTSNILNIVFNNLEEANGIMVNIIFALNGFRFSEETTINTDELLENLKYDNDFKQEQIGGLYLEYVADYLYKNRKQLTNSTVRELTTSILESKVVNNDGEDNNYKNGIFSHDYIFLNLLSSYSSFPTSFGVHKYSDGVTFNEFSLFNYQTDNEYMNNFFNKNANLFDGTKDMFFLDYQIKDLKDSNLNVYRDLNYGTKYYSYIDNICAMSILGNLNYRQKISDFLYVSRIKLSNQEYSEYQVHRFGFLINDVIKKISVELFNTKQNGDLDEFRNESYKKLYEEFYYRLFYILNYTYSDKIQELKEDDFLSSDGISILFSSIHKKIENISELLYEAFTKTFYDGDFLERISREIMADNLRPTEKVNVDVQAKIKAVKDYIMEFTLEFENQYERNKTKIHDRAYNIFLTKLNYFLNMYCINRNFENNSVKYEEQFNFNINIPMKIFLLSSAIHSILLTNTSTRTDHFDNSIILGVKNIGYKISKYNIHLKYENIEKPMFYDLFKDENQNIFFYYKNEINYDDFKYERKTVFDKIPNKDINFFYGNKIEIKNLHKDLINSSITKYFKDEEELLKAELRNEEQKFITDIYEDSGNTEVQLNVSYNRTSLDLNNIDFPFMNYGFIPSHYTELFYDIEQNQYIMNEKMKKRVIGNRDVFKDVREISNVIFDYGNCVIPDYDVMIFKQKLDKEVSGNLYKTVDSNISVVLKNASSISVVKNPKTKIKTLTLVLNNTSKSIFNFNPENGSFDIKSLEKGKIDIIHIEPGDEIKVRVGFDEKYQIFTGFINIIENIGNQLVLNCSSFTSSLYNNKINNLTLCSNELGALASAGNFFKGIFNKAKTTLTEIPKSIYTNIRNSYLSNKILNDHIFIDEENRYSDVFNPLEKASMYSAFSLSLTTIPTIILSKFMNGKVSDITQSKLATKTYLNKSLESSLGSMLLSYESTGSTPDLFININNVDRDYETYGYLRHDYGSFYSINSYKNSGTKISDEEIKDKIFENNNSDVKPEAIPNTSKDEINYGITHLPVDKEANIITSLFKERRIKNNRYVYHKGIDICNHSSSEYDNIYSVADGRVILASYGKDTGNYVKILHTVIGEEKNLYFVSAYMHLDKIKVKYGDVISAGTNIGIMGNTGSSSQKHLHFEMYISNNLGTVKTLLLNPFGINMLPENDWVVDWNQVNILADNGRYTELWQEDYDKSKKTIEYKKTLGVI